MILHRFDWQWIASSLWIYQTWVQYPSLTSPVIWQIFSWSVIVWIITFTKHEYGGIDFIDKNEILAKLLILHHEQSSSIPYLIQSVILWGLKQVWKFKTITSFILPNICTMHAKRIYDDCECFKNQSWSPLFSCSIHNI